MSDLPPGWAKANLEQVAEWGSGGTPSRSRTDFYGGTIPWIKTGELGQGLITDTEEKITQDALDNSSAKLFPKGSVAIAMYGATIGKIATLGIDAATNQACAVGVPYPGVTTTEYLLHYLASQKSEFVAKGQGGAQPNISQTIIKSWPIPVAPLKEQNRIAEKLDSVLSRAEAIRGRLDRIPQILKKFREAVLQAAVAGRLTEDWRGEPELTGWVTKCASEACTMVQSGGTPKAGFTESAGVPFLKVYNIVDQQIAFDYRPQYVPRTTHEKELRKSRTLPGDVLMNIVGPPLGKVAVVPDTYPEWNINQAITLFRPGAEVSTQWIYTVLCSGKNVADVIHQTRGSVGQVNISLSQCRNFEIPIPSLAEQAEILRRLGELFVLADSLQRRYQDTVTCVEKLTPSVLKKAFRGGLVPQDPNDEPAGVMLKRVRAAVSADQTPTTTKTRAAAGRRG